MKHKQQIALLSIKPEYAKKILLGEKIYEYRKVPLKEETSHILLYATSPLMKIVGIVEMKSILEGAPSTIWEKTKKDGGITRKFYREYFKGKKKAFAIVLDNVAPLNYWVDPKIINPKFRAPQSFQYVDINFYNRVFDIGKKEKFDSRIFFFGGIHGVGKSTFCKKLKKDTGIDTASASELIEGERKFFVKMHKGKKVKNIDTNQQHLLKALKKKSFVDDFILDGHFCLLNNLGEIERVPFDIFEKINPRELFVLEAAPEDIKKNLMYRDAENYDISLIKNMLIEEHSYAKEISKKLNVPLSIIHHRDYLEVKEYITNSRIIFGFDKTRSKEISLNKLFDEFATVALTQYDAKVRFDTMASRGDKKRGLELLDKLDDQ